MARLRLQLPSIPQDAPALPVRVSTLRYADVARINCGEAKPYNGAYSHHIIVDAAMRGDHEVMTAFRATLADEDVRDAFLRRVAEYGLADRLAWFDIPTASIPASTQHTILMLAVRYGHVNAVKALVERGFHFEKPLDRLDVMGKDNSAAMYGYLISLTEGDAPQWKDDLPLLAFVTSAYVKEARAAYAKCLAWENLHGFIPATAVAQASPRGFDGEAFARFRDWFFLESTCHINEAEMRAYACCRIFGNTERFLAAWHAGGKAQSPMALREYMDRVAGVAMREDKSGSRSNNLYHRVRSSKDLARWRRFGRSLLIDGLNHAKLPPRWIDRWKNLPDPAI